MVQCEADNILAVRCTAICAWSVFIIAGKPSPVIQGALVRAYSHFIGASTKPMIVLSPQRTRFPRQFLELWAKNCM